MSGMKQLSRLSKHPNPALWHPVTLIEQRIIFSPSNIGWMVFFSFSFFFLFHNDSFVRILIMDLRFTDINEFNCAWSAVQQITLKIQMVSIENEFQSLYL